MAEEAVSKLRPGTAQLSPAASDAASPKGGSSCSQRGIWSLLTELGQRYSLGGLLALLVLRGAQSVFVRGGRARCTQVYSSALTLHTGDTLVSYCHSKG